MKKFDSVLFNTLIQNVLISLYPADLPVLFDVLFVILTCLKEIQQHRVSQRMLTRLERNSSVLKSG